MQPKERLREIKAKNEMERQRQRSRKKSQRAETGWQGEKHLISFYILAREREEREGETGATQLNTKTVQETNDDIIIRAIIEIQNSLDVDNETTNFFQITRLMTHNYTEYICSGFVCVDINAEIPFKGTSG